MISIVSFFLFWAVYSEMYTGQNTANEMIFEFWMFYFYIA